MTERKPKPRTRKTAKAAPRKKRAPAKRATPRAAGGRLRVRQTRSGIGHAATYRRTLRALGLKHYQDETVVSDTPSMRGMLFKVRHLVTVTPEEQ